MLLLKPFEVANALILRVSKVLILLTYVYNVEHIKQ